MTRLIIALICFIAVWAGVINFIQGQNSEETTEYITTPEYSNIPEPYYTSAPQQYGVDALQEYLQQKKWSRDYEVDVFDCTEMSAFLERALENEGFHAYIMGGEFDGNPHGWVKVQISPRTKPKSDKPRDIVMAALIDQEKSFVIVEATTLTIITFYDAEYSKYYEEHAHETIYDAMELCPSSYDWWN